MRDPLGTPFYAHVRRAGHTPDEARDLTQAYSAELLNKGFIDDVDPSKGCFRSFLLTALQHFLSHEREKARALKRGGDARTISLDSEDGERRHGFEPADELTPDEVFERRWALTVLEQAMARLNRESAEAGGKDQFDRLQPYLTDTGPKDSYRQVASDLGMSEGAVKTAVHRLRQR